MRENDRSEVRVQPIVLAQAGSLTHIRLNSSLAPEAKFRHFFRQHSLDHTFDGGLFLTGEPKNVPHLRANILIVLVVIDRIEHEYFAASTLGAELLPAHFVGAARLEAIQAAAAIHQAQHEVGHEEEGPQSIQNVHHLIRGVGILRDQADYHVAIEGDACSDQVQQLVQHQAFLFDAHDPAGHVHDAPDL